MKIPKFLQEMALNALIKGIYDGSYGPGLKKAADALRGYKTVIGFTMGLITAALAAFPSSISATLAPIMGSVGVVFLVAGLIDKGSNKIPPKMPESLRDAFVFVLSITTIVGKSLNAFVLVAKDMGDPRFLAVSYKVQFIALAITTVTGFFGTFLDHPISEYPEVTDK